MTRNKLNETWEALRKIVKKRNLKFYTASQPPRPDCGIPAYVPPPTGDEIIVVDYIGLMMPKESV